MPVNGSEEGPVAASEHGPGGLAARGWLWLVAGLVIGALLGYVASAIVSDDAQPAEKAIVSTQPAENVEAIAERWIAAVEMMDEEQVASLYSEEAVWVDEALGDRFTGRSGVEKGWAIFHLPGFEILELEPVAIASDGAVIRWKLAGTVSPFSSEPWEVTGVSALEISGGEITTETVYYDSEPLFS